MNTACKRYMKHLPEQGCTRSAREQGTAFSRIRPENSREARVRTRRDASTHADASHACFARSARDLLLPGFRFNVIVRKCRAELLPG